MKILLREKLRDRYHRVYRFNTENRKDWVKKQATLIPAGSKVLDVGAGTGQYRPFFVHCRYFSQDFGREPGTIGSYTQLDYECDITHIPVPDNTFDALLCTEVLEHIPEPIAVVKEMARILRPNGCLLLTAPLGSFLHQKPYHFYGGFTPYWYRKFLAENGFEIISIEANQGFFSWFGQEAQRFSTYLYPMNIRQFRVSERISLSFLWLLTWPFSVLLPLFGKWLDRLGIDQMATVGYHIVAIKRGN